MSVTININRFSEFNETGPKKTEPSGCAEWDLSFWLRMASSECVDRILFSAVGTGHQADDFLYYLI